MARSNDGQAKLQRMIKGNTDGSFTVTFPGEPNHPIRVGGLTVGEKMLGSSCEQGYLFPTILEKAYGKLLNDSHPEARTHIASEGAKHAFNDYAKGLELLTGNPVESINTGKSGLNPFALTLQNQYLDAMKQARKEGKIAIAGVKAPPEGQKLAPLIHANHAYVVESFDDKTITLRDPLPGSDRVLPPLTWQEFHDNFNVLIIEKEKSHAPH